MNKATTLEEWRLMIMSRVNQFIIDHKEGKFKDIEFLQNMDDYALTLLFTMFLDQYLESIHDGENSIISDE